MGASEAASTPCYVAMDRWCRGADRPYNRLLVQILLPIRDDAIQFGYVENIERRGTVFKTFEGVLIPYKELMDTTRIYSRDFIFTAVDEKVATRLKRAQISAEPVRVGYRKYHATLPWRGASKIVVTSVDSVNPDKILPPEFAPHR